MAPFSGKPASTSPASAPSQRKFGGAVMDFNRDKEVLERVTRDFARVLKTTYSGPPIRLTGHRGL